jgi:hypothetical protein
MKIINPEIRVDPNDKWVERNVKEDDGSVEVPEAQWRLDNRLHGIPEEEWDDDPKEAYLKEVEDNK